MPMARHRSLVTRNKPRTASRVAAWPVEERRPRPHAGTAREPGRANQIGHAADEQTDTRYNQAYRPVPTDLHRSLW